MALNRECYSMRHRGALKLNKTRQITYWPSPLHTHMCICLRKNSFNVQHTRLRTGHIVPTCVFDWERERSFNVQHTRLRTGHIVPTCVFDWERGHSMSNTPDWGLVTLYPHVYLTERENSSNVQHTRLRTGHIVPTCVFDWEREVIQCPTHQIKDWSHCTHMCIWLRERSHSMSNTPDWGLGTCIHMCIWLRERSHSMSNTPDWGLVTLYPHVHLTEREKSFNVQHTRLRTGHIVPTCVFDWERDNSFNVQHTRLRTGHIVPTCVFDWERELIQCPTHQIGDWSHCTHMCIWLKERTHSMSNTPDWGLVTLYPHVYLTERDNSFNVQHTRLRTGHIVPTCVFDWEREGIQCPTHQLEDWSHCTHMCIWLRERTHSMSNTPDWGLVTLYPHVYLTEREVIQCPTHQIKDWSHCTHMCIWLREREVIPCPTHQIEDWSHCTHMCIWLRERSHSMSNTPD